ncbi:class 3 adenylate cyclase [Tsukamurella ocularis]|nr:class 3 adenylate cyclase [Tsukamurella ocularis]
MECLKKPGHAEDADSYDDASVLFVDISGFTEMSSRTAPADVVRYLDRLYTTLDALVERPGLERIKTTGDSYVVVSGDPEPRPDHLEELVRFAVALQGAAAGVTNAGGRATPLRLGLADGPWSQASSDRRSSSSMSGAMPSTSRLGWSRRGSSAASR